MAELTTAIQALSAHGNRVHAGIHQSRKAIRRTRAALSLADAALGPGVQLLDRELRRLNKASSRLRDVHALVETLDRFCAKPHADETRRVLSRAHRIASRRRAEFARSADFAAAVETARAMLVLLRASLSGLPWDSIAAPVIADAMQTSARKAEVAREQAYARDRVEDWHRWRRRMRRRSQQFRAANAAGFPATLPLREKSIAEQLGVLQDLSLLIAHCDRESPFDKPTRTQLRRFAERALTRQRKRIKSVAP